MLEEDDERRGLQEGDVRADELGFTVFGVAVGGWEARVIAGNGWYRSCNIFWGRSRDCRCCGRVLATAADVGRPKRGMVGKLREGAQTESGRHLALDVSDMQEVGKLNSNAALQECRGARG